MVRDRRNKALPPARRAHRRSMTTLLSEENAAKTANASLPMSTVNADLLPAKPEVVMEHLAGTGLLAEETTASGGKRGCVSSSVTFPVISLDYPCPLSSTWK